MGSTLLPEQNLVTEASNGEVDPPFSFSMSNETNSRDDEKYMVQANKQNLATVSLLVER